jgi:uncharacterized protein (DUF427 family)
LGHSGDITESGAGTVRAYWNGQVIAESDRTIVVEGNHYFPADAVKQEYLRPSDWHTTCAWKGEASYHHVEVDGKVAQDAAWYYPQASTPAKRIENYVAFWRGVEVKVGESAASRML